MRLLVVGHSFVTAFAQAKYVAMKSLRRELAVRLVVPPAAQHVFRDYRPELASGLRREEVVVIRSIGGVSHMTYLHDPVALAGLMRQFRPTNIHVEEDPHSAVGSETACLAASLCHDAVLSFFIWDNLNRSPRFPLGAVKRGLTRLSFLHARLVVCGNERARALLPAKGYHGSVEVIPQMGLDPVALNHDRASDSGKVPVIGYFGRLVEEKGLRDLFAALQTLLDRSWQLVIYGNGSLREEIGSRWRSAFGDRLTCHNPVPHADVQSKLGNVDIFVLPSYTIPTWQEQFGLTLAQAMLAGCACVGSSSGAIPEVLAGAGLLFPERNVPALATAVRQLLESETERQQFGQAARAVALARYTNEKVARRYLQAFDAVAN